MPTGKLGNRLLEGGADLVLRRTFVGKLFKEHPRNARPRQSGASEILRFTLHRQLHVLERVRAILANVNQGFELVLDHGLHFLIQREQVLGSCPLDSLIHYFLQGSARGGQQPPARDRREARRFGVVVRVKKAKKFRKLSAAIAYLPQFIGKVAAQTDVDGSRTERE